MALLRIIALALLSVGSFGSALAQDYPARQVRMVLPSNLLDTPRKDRDVTFLSFGCQEQCVQIVLSSSRLGDLFRIYERYARLQNSEPERNVVTSQDPTI